jgi:hypothetical protein
MDQIYYFTTCYFRCRKNLNFDVCSSEKKIAYMLEKIYLDLLKLLSMLFSSCFILIVVLQYCRIIAKRKDRRSNLTTELILRIFINFRFTRQVFKLKIKYFEHFVNFNCLFILIICSKISLFKQEESSVWSSLD